MDTSKLHKDDETMEEVIADKGKQIMETEQENLCSRVQPFEMSQQRIRNTGVPLLPKSSDAPKSTVLGTGLQNPGMNPLPQEGQKLTLSDQIRLGWGIEPLLTLTQLEQLQTFKSHHQDRLFDSKEEIRNICQGFGDDAINSIFTKIQVEFHQQQLEARAQARTPLSDYTSAQPASKRRRTAPDETAEHQQRVPQGQQNLQDGNEPRIASFDHTMRNYIDFHRLTSLAMMNVRGEVWYRSETFPQFMPGELSVIRNNFENPGSLMLTGFNIGGTNYMVVEEKPGAVIHGLNVSGGITIMETIKGLIFGIYDDPDNLVVSKNNVLKLGEILNARRD